MKIFNFTTNNTPVTLTHDQIDDYSPAGHPNCILDGEEGDIWILLEDFVEKHCGTISDQNGGEFHSLVSTTGHMCEGKYVLYDIELEDGNGPSDIEFKLKGFFVNEHTFFIQEVSFDETVL